MVSELVRDISDGHRTGATLRPGRRAGWWGLPLALLAAMTWSAEAWSISGETDDTLGAHQAAGSACSELRDASGVSGGDLYLVCNADRNRAGAEPCDVYSLSTLVRGQTVGFCADSFMGRQVRAVNVAEPVLEENKTVRRTSFGANLGLTRGGAPTDVICVTFAGAGSGAGATQGDRVCVEVYKDGPAEDPPQSQCGPSGGPLLNVTSNGCNFIEHELRRTITGGGQVPVFSHALLSNAIANVGAANSHALFVCQQYKWRCADESGASAIDYSVSFTDTQSPGCKTMSGVRYCW